MRPNFSVEIEERQENNNTNTISEPNIPLEQKKMEQVFKNVKPSVFNLPQNPLSIKSFKYNFIKTRVEKSRAEYVRPSLPLTVTNSTGNTRLRN